MNIAITSAITIVYLILLFSVCAYAQKLQKQKEKEGGTGNFLLASKSLPTALVAFMMAGAGIGSINTTGIAEQVQTAGLSGMSAGFAGAVALIVLAVFGGRRMRALPYNTMPSMAMAYCGWGTRYLLTLGGTVIAVAIAALQFVGGGAMLFHLQPDSAYVNDVNPELINLYEVIRDDVDSLLAELETFRNEPDFFYAVRDWDRDPQAYAALNRSEAGREKLCTVTRALGDRAARRLTGSQARALYGRPVMSVSRLETFAQCPYRHFVRYGLAPQQPVEPGVDRAELGTLYHEAAERFSRALTAQPDFPHVGEAASEALMEEAVAPLIAAWRQSPLGESARGEAIARRIGRTARRAAKNIAAQFAQSRFAPMHFELTFGKNGVAPIALALPDGSFVYLQGRIDRIDVLDGQTQRIRVIDYKSGTKTFDPTMAYYGIQLQLLLYLAAALARTPEAQAAGFFYCRIADPTVRTESRIKEEVERQIAKKLALSGVSLSDVEVLRAQDARHAAMITRDGQPGGQYRGSMTDQDGMDAMVAFARRKAAQLAGEAYAGVIEDAPAAFGAYSACASCDYAAVCGFDPTTRRRRQLSKKALSDLR